MTRIDMIMDLQFGSTGKGLLAGYLARRHLPDTIVTAWAANAGHSYIDEAGRKYVHTQVPNGIVANSVRRILFGPGSLIDPDTMARELDSVREHLFNVEISIHPHAAIILERHRQEERAGSNVKIGSTMKGVGAAMIERIRRDPDSNNVAMNALVGHELHRYVVTCDEYDDHIAQAHCMQIEGAQGFDLSMYHGMYPYTTSRDVSTWQVLADCGISVGAIRKDAGNLNVYGTVRTFPIRVANRFDTEGRQIGTSGPCYPDQVELDWERDFGIKPELTTVTKLPRRIFSFSSKQVFRSAQYCGVDAVFLNFANYCKTFGDLVDIVDRINAPDPARGVRWLGFGPADNDIVEIRNHDDLLACASRFGD